MTDIWVVDDCVQGHNHAVCEDSACARMMRSDTHGDIVLFAVADGHGSPACVRSAKGSELAIKVALDWLARLANNIVSERDGWGKQLFDDVRERMATPSDAHFPEAAGTHSSSVSYPIGASHSACDSFAKSLVKDWRDAVTADADPQLNPLTDAEIAAIHGAGYTWEKDHFFRLYGTTLIAGALLPDSLFLLQQGDGCCCVMYENGDAENPIAEDERCVGNVTSSMCDDDAAAYMRFAIVDRQEDDPIACFVATDGVEKSVAVNGGVEDFFRGVVLDAVEMPDDVAAKSHLHVTLASLSERGSHDDTSVAGFVDMGRANAAVQFLAARRQRYRAELELRMLEQRQGSLIRGVERYRAAEAERERFRPWMEEYQKNERRIQELKTLSAGGETNDSPVAGGAGAGSGSVRPVTKQAGSEPAVRESAVAQQAVPERAILRQTDSEVTAPEAAGPQQGGPESESQTWPEHGQPSEEQFEAVQASAAPTAQLPIAQDGGPRGGEQRGRGPKLQVDKNGGSGHYPVPTKRVSVPLLLGVLFLAVGVIIVALMITVPLGQMEKVEVTSVSSAATEGDASVEADEQGMGKEATNGEVREVLVSTLEGLGNLDDATLLVNLGIESGDVQTLEDANLAGQARGLAEDCVGVLLTELDDQDGDADIIVSDDGQSAFVTLSFPGALYSLVGQMQDAGQLLAEAQQELDEALLSGESTGLARTINLKLVLVNDEWSLAEGQLARIGDQTGLTQVCERAAGLLVDEDETSQSGEQYGSGVSDVYDSSRDYDSSSAGNTNR